MDNNLDRFVKAQENSYSAAFNELKHGRKETHWMWFIFPQIAGLGHSDTARYYAIEGVEEAESYLKHPVLGKRLKDISALLLQIHGKSAREIFGKPDDLKLRSCMTLFSTLKNADPVFQKVIDKYFDGEQDVKTLEMIR